MLDPEKAGLRRGCLRASSRCWKQCHIRLAGQVRGSDEGRFSQRRSQVFEVWRRAQHATPLAPSRSAAARHGENEHQQPRITVARNGVRPASEGWDEARNRLLGAATSVR